ncbi:hypothetical protein BK133_02905 [Paenibacillus sp. FSL H8-0548]|uniref:MraY family glycosyltransferase n=1 Tax=Paenibacillus sp. FSL H8-0548 TaxID=1920422 RepID=UPI00096EEC71|nr:MraY family glycosyltransferase [Paenibacillus sp. FSL H8-0548]OMF37952.1 hypothetical protein BK133_02905 [Paenibacillus sp. FSL H8-0548]
MIVIIFVFLLTTLLTPAAIKLSNKFNIVDHPNHLLKTHQKPIPNLGGLVMFISMIIPLMVLQGQALYASENFVFLVGAVIIIIGGLIDDRYALRPVTKLVFQAAAGISLFSYGFHTNFFEWSIMDGMLTLIWLLGVINAINLIDIMDGLAAGVAAISSVFLCILLLAKGEFFFSSILLGVAAACLGFLLFNFNPARIYLGDAGSQLLGYLLACSALKWSINENFDHRLFIPILILGIPLFETIFVSILRLKAKRSPFKGSKDHFALRLVKLGYSVKFTVILTYLFALVLGLLACLMLFYNTMALYIIGASFVGALLIALRLSQIDMSAY